MATAPAYPDILKESNWQRHKGIVARIVTTPSKISEKLKELATHYAAMPWAQILTVPTNLSLEATTQAQFNAVQRFNGEVKPYVAFITSTKEHAVSVKGVWDKNKLVPPPSKTYLDNIIKGCDAFKNAIGAAWTAAMTEFENAKKHAALNHPTGGAGAVTAIKGAGKGGADPKLKIKPGAMPSSKEHETSESESGA